MDTETLIDFGGAIKALGNGKIGGYLVRYSDAEEPDLEGDFFSKATDFGLDSGDPLPIYYNHGMDTMLKKRRVGRGTVTMTDAGVWVEAQLALRDDYERAVYAMVEEGKVGWSSGAVAHLVDRAPEKGAYHIKHWPLGEASITPTPAAGPVLTAVMPLKRWAAQLATPEGTPEADSTSAAQPARKGNAIDPNALALELELLQLD